MANDPKVPRKTRPMIKLDTGAGVHHRRPTLDLNQVEELASIGCTQEEAAGVLRLTVPGFEWQLKNHPEVRTAWEWGRAASKMSLRRIIWAQAMGLSSAAVNAAQHLAKHVLHETDKAADRKAGIVEGADANAGAFQFDPAKLKNLSTEDLVTLAGLFAKLTDGGVGRDESGPSDPSSLH